MWSRRTRRSGGVTHVPRRQPGPGLKLSRGWTPAFAGNNDDQPNGRSIELGGVESEAVEEPRELLAAESRGQSSARLRLLAEERGDGAQSLVAVLMTLRVIELLEVIEIEQHE